VVEAAAVSVIYPQQVPWELWVSLVFAVVAAWYLAMKVLRW
jgi:hypothetical protein